MHKLAIVFSFVINLLPLQYGFDWVSFNMTQRINAQGKTTRMDSRVFFRKNGEMVTQISSSEDIFIFNNKQGELKIYNPKENSVFKSVNYQYGTQNNTFYYFLGQVPNMGLEEVGYSIGESKMDEGMLVTYWYPPQQLAADISKVELVSDGEKAVFMGFYDNEDEYFKKIFFYDFQPLRGILFPNSITEIGYIEEDSVITKTTFNYFEFDQPEAKEILDMKIPDNAKLIK